MQIAINRWQFAVFTCTPWVIAVAIGAAALEGEVLADDVAPAARLGIARMIVAELRTNYEKLLTWSGSYDLTDETFRAKVLTLATADDTGQRRGAIETIGRFWEVRHVAVQFAIDLRTNRLFTTYEVVGDPEVTDLSTKTTRQNPAIPFRERHVLTASEWIRAKPATDPNAELLGYRVARGRGVNSATIDAAEKGKKLTTFSSVVDPRQFFALSGEMTFATALHDSAEWMAQGKALPLTIHERSSEAGPVYDFAQEYRISGVLDESPATLVTTTFDPAVGYNPTRLVEQSTLGNTTLEREWDYQSVGGVFIPSRYRVAKYFDTELKEREIVRQFRLRACQVNEPIDDDSFSWDRLGLVQGDQVRDVVQGAILRYDGERLVPSKEFKGDPKKDLERGAFVPVTKRTWIALLTLNAGFVVVCAVLFVLKRRRRASVS